VLSPDLHIEQAGALVVVQLADPGTVRMIESEDEVVI
jgi:hypothetical protein